MWTAKPVVPATFITEYKGSDTITLNVGSKAADRLFYYLVLLHEFSWKNIEEATQTLTPLDESKKYVVEVSPAMYNGGIILAIQNGRLDHLLCGISDKFESLDVAGLTPATVRNVAFDEGADPAMFGLPHCGPTSVHRLLWRVLSNVIVPYLEASAREPKESDIHLALDSFFTPDIVSQIVTAAQEEIKALTKMKTLCPMPGMKPIVRVLPTGKGADRAYYYKSSLPIFSFHITLTGTTLTNMDTYNYD